MAAASLFLTEEEEEVWRDMPAIPPKIRGNSRTIAKTGETETWESYRFRKAHLERLHRAMGVA